MKKLGAFLVGLGLVAGTVFAAATNTATSVNIVGFNKVNCPTNKYVLVSCAFEAIDGHNLTAQDVFGDQLPLGSSVYAYNNQLNGYDIDNYGFAGWGSTITFKGYMGFWIAVPEVEAGPASYDVSISGQVPMSSAISNTVYSGFTLLGFPYSASVLWTNTSLAVNAQLGDTVHVWDVGAQAYSSYNLGFSGWGDPNLVLNVGQGFWFETTSATFTNTQVRPYNP